MSSKKKAVALSVSLALVGMGMTAVQAGTTDNAEEGPPNPSAPAPSTSGGVAGTVSLTSDYVFRGISQTDQDPAVQGGIEYAADSGFYIGAWGSNISWLSDLSSDAAPISSSLEFDAYGGYRGKFSDSVGFDVGALYYYYPGEFPDGFNSANTGEVYAGITVGPASSSPLSVKYFYSLTDLFGYVDSDGSGYLDLAVNWTFTPGWTLNAHGGKQWIENNEAFEYTDWKLGVTKAFDSGFSIAAAYSDTDTDEALYTNPHGNYIGDSTFTLTFAKAF
ncbi:TorF family putative porin [Lysobacter sp. CFH 32150]|uniref:TorF family putative porin n=1 Tax=Lysobacter sp. CFH 32150 TaxID=2927128 RepID=UPI001FA7EF17|nr:TorF family putative porin [Lysobacter sp. CFH 32150]MCI4568073.1 TorF family putative porin [Lysobacter sp. CFH 32150]